VTDDEEEDQSCTAEEVLASIQEDIAAVGFCTGLIVIAEVVGGEGQPLLMWRRDTKTSGTWKHMGMIEATLVDLRGSWETATSDDED
jgi:hypothetical protein